MTTRHKVLAIPVLFGILLSASPFSAGAQTACPAPGWDAPPNEPGVIHWDAFPEFQSPAPFKIVYEGPRLGDSLQRPLAHGFTHIANQLGNVGPGDFYNLPPEKRALTWYHVATCYPGQPWKFPCNSPWNNDTLGYRQRWADNLGYYAALYADTDGDSLPQVDLLVADIESGRLNGFNDNADYIDSLYYHPEGCDIPPALLAGPAADFVLAYERDMMLLYNVPMRFARQALADNGYATRLSSYGDGPIPTTYHKILHHSWPAWTSELSLVNYVVKDTAGQAADDAPFYQSCDFISPHAYYIYDHDPYYLAYCLFQVEANRAWSDKELILWTAMRYLNGDYIEPHMAEATAVMPLLGGADGLWVWDYWSAGAADTAHLRNYDYFVRGLERLSAYADFFEGDYEVFIPQTAWDLFKYGKPVWRAVVNGNGILIGAQNPFAGEGEITYLPVAYQNWSDTLALTGQELLLCDFIWQTSAVGAAEPPVLATVSPNPFFTQVTFQFPDNEIFMLEICDALGRVVFENANCSGRLTVNAQDWPEGCFTFSIKTANGRIRQRGQLFRFD